MTFCLRAHTATLLILKHGGSELYTRTDGINIIYLKIYENSNITFCRSYGNLLSSWNIKVVHCFQIFETIFFSLFVLSKLHDR